MPPTPLWEEDHISQVPALQLLQNMSWQYLTPAEALDLRGGRAAAVVLDGILEQQLRQMNRICLRGREYPFTEGNIVAGVQAIKDVMYDGLVRTNEKVYDLLCLGKSLPQSIDGDVKSFTLHYIDWEHPERNVYHVTEEFDVERAGRKDCYRPDVVLFVNGIPLAVIECKRPDLGAGKDPMVEAVSQHIRNQKDDGIPKLFLYGQLLLSVAMNQAKYATTGTPAKFWAKWKERGDHETEIHKLANKPLSGQKKDRLFAGRFGYVREYFDAMEAEGGRQVTEQDRALWALCRPQRLLELAQRFTLFDAGEKKVARYQQYFCVRKIMDRIRRLEEGRRQGGVVWHTQGSGKSLTMVMLAKAIAMEPTISDYKIVLVTDRVDLDDQIYGTFRQCDVQPEQATTGANLVAMLSGRKQRVITTVINKFEAAVGKQGLVIDDPNIFVLVDEGHRTQYGPLHAKMRRVLSNACYIGFTGTPVTKKAKNTIQRFGGLIDTYTINDAVEDGAVVRLLYEGRHVEQTVDQKSMDDWFDRTTENLTDQQKADLKKKFATADRLFEAEPVVRRIAWDISEHFQNHWQGTPFKAQLVTPSKATALLYKECLDEFGKVKSAVLISGPDEREGEEDIYKPNKEKVIRFWKGMMDRYGTEKEYNRQIINGFKHGDPADPQGDAPEIIIVVDKLLTGFDAPCNAVLYLARTLRDHTLLQAIARVNRLHDGKDFGYIIDYRGVLQNLDKALDMYGNLPEFDAEDLAGTVTEIRSVFENLPQKHSALWEVFKEIRHTRDQEEYERWLALDDRRVRFYERLAEFARTLDVALASVTFLEETPEPKVKEYTKDLKFFEQLRRSVRRRYAEVVDYGEYEPKIRKLLDTYLGTGDVEQIAGPLDLFNQEERQKVLEETVGEAAKADIIAHNTKRVIEEKWQEDPAFYKKFSRMLLDLIEEFRAERLKAAEYLKQVTGIMQSVISRTGDDVPDSIRDRDTAKAYYGAVREILQRHVGNGADGDGRIAAISLAIEKIIDSRHIVNWTTNTDVQNRMRQNIEDYLFEVKDKEGVDLTFDDIDTIMDECLKIAKARRP
jgi:type I restriction enzyme R subunit